MGKHGSDCELSLEVFLVILTVWSIPVQIVVSLLNYTSTAHHSRDKYFPLYVAPLNVAGEVIGRPPEEGPLYAAPLTIAGEAIGRPPEEGPLHAAPPNIAGEATHTAPEERGRLAEVGRS